MDSILVVGSQDQKLTGFLKKMGYALIEADDSNKLADVIERQVFDLVLIDTSSEFGGIDLCQFLRSHDATKQVPIVCLADRPRTRQAIKDLELDKLDVFDTPYQIGRVVGSVATHLRLTKNAGRDQRVASLFEMNSALRDLTDRFQKELKEAHSIQNSLLPKVLPTDDRFEISALYQPLDEVGGDWYYAEKHGDDALSMQIADVTGHGLSAAFIGCMTKLALYASKTIEPAELLTHMNKLMAPQLPQGRFVTMGSYLYIPSSGIVKFSRAGHPPAFLFSRKSNEVSQLMAEGYPVGFFDDSTYTSGEAKLEQGDFFIAITDGLSEAQNKKMETFGMDRIAACLKELPPQASAQDARDWILAHMNTFRDGRLLKDDVTMIVLKRMNA